MRRLIASVALAGAACASQGPPPGGPERHTPPEIVTITPDSGSTQVRASRVEFTFDEVVTDQPGGTSNGFLDRLFLISPTDGAPRVHWHLDRIDVSPRHGFKPNTAYSVTLLPGLTDRRNNVTKAPVTIVFSTGDSIPRYGVVGTVFDWAAERPAPAAFVEAIRRPDSTVFLAYADSSGTFSLGPLDTGTYTVFGIIDKNNNRQLDRGESWDSLHVVIRDVRPGVELLAIGRDTTPPRISNVRVEDSLAIRVTFDQYLASVMPFHIEALHIQRSDSTPVLIASVLREQEFDSLLVVERARQDSVRRDSIAKAASPGRGAPPPAAAAPAPTAAANPAAGARPTAPPPPKPSKPAPPHGFVVRIAPATPLVVGRSYRMVVDSVRSIAGRLGASQMPFTVPKPQVADTSHRARPDSTKKP